jgi:hypothetical protein
MSELLQFIQTPIVYYAIVLTVAWVLIQLASRFSRKEINIHISSKFLFMILALYILLSLIIIQTDVGIFPYLQAVMLALTLWFITSAPPEKSRILLVITLIVALMPVIVMISANPLPLGDDARFTGYVATINADGRWIPFKYNENPYYQFFNLVSAVEYIIASVTGVGVANIMGYYLILKLCLYFTYLITVYLIVRALTKDGSSSLLAVLLLSIVPPLAISQVVPEAYAMVLFLVTALLMLKRLFRGAKSQLACVVAMYPLWIAGILAHAMYALMIVAFALPFILIALLRGSKRNDMIKSLGLLAIISLTYWIYTYVLDAIIQPNVNALTRFVDLLTGQITPFSGGTSLPWYTPALSVYFIAWALVPSIIASYVILSIKDISSGISKGISTVKGISKGILKGSHSISRYLGTSVSILGLLGLGGTVINFALRTIPTFGGRYFYWLYLLMLPLSALVVRKVSKKLIGLLLCIMLISIVSFYGIQDPTLSANTYGEKIGWADRTSWSIGSSLAPCIDPNSTVWLDSRVGVPISALSPSLSEVSHNRPVFVLVGKDEVGLYAMEKDPRNVNFFVTNLNVDPEGFVNQIGEMNIVYNGSVYVGVWAP